MRPREDENRTMYGSIHGASELWQLARAVVEAAQSNPARNRAHKCQERERVVRRDKELRLICALLKRCLPKETFISGMMGLRGPNSAASAFAPMYPATVRTVGAHRGPSWGARAPVVLQRWDRGVQYRAVQLH